MPEARRLWRGLALVCVDKTSLALPECPELLKHYGYQKVRKLYGNVGAELCVVIDAAGRVPLAHADGKVYTSEKALLAKLKGSFHAGQLVLIDAGYHAFANFKLLRERGAHFLVPAKSTAKPKMLKKLGGGDYLAEITCSETKEKMVVRVVYVQRDGFRRRRLFTSLLDAAPYPAAELAAIYHERWHIETFYRDFKVTMQGNKWHCRSVDAFKKELACKLILACLVRLAAGEAAERGRTAPGKMSFAHGHAEFKLMFAKILDQRKIYDLALEWGKMVVSLVGHVIKEKPGRAFPREKNTYRKKTRSRGCGKVGRPRKARPEAVGPSIRPKTLTDSKGTTWLLS